MVAFDIRGIPGFMNTGPIFGPTEIDLPLPVPLVCEYTREHCRFGRLPKRERAPALSPTLPRARDRLQNGRLTTAPRVSALRERPRCARHGRCAHARAPGRLRSASPSARVSFLKAPAWTRHPSRRGRALDGAQESLREGEGRLIATPHLARDGRPMDMNIRRRPPWPTPPHHGGRSRVRAMSRPRTTKASGAVVTEMRRYRFTPCAPGDTGGVRSRRCMKERQKGAHTPRAHPSPKVRYPTEHRPAAKLRRRERRTTSSLARVIAPALRLARAVRRIWRPAQHGATRACPARSDARKRRAATSHGLDATATGSRERPGRPRARLPAPSPRARKITRVTARRAFKFCPQGFPPILRHPRAILTRAASNRAMTVLTASYANMFTPVRARPQALARAAVPVRSPSTRRAHSWHAARRARPRVELKPSRTSCRCAPATRFHAYPRDARTPLRATATARVATTTAARRARPIFVSRARRRASSEDGTDAFGPARTSRRARRRRASRHLECMRAESCSARRCLRARDSRRARASPLARSRSTWHSCVLSFED